MCDISEEESIRNGWCLRLLQPCRKIEDLFLAFAIIRAEDECATFVWRGEDDDEGAEHVGSAGRVLVGFEERAGP